MRSVFLFAIALCAFGPSDVFGQTVATAATRIAYFSPQRAFAESAVGKAARAEFERLELERAKAIEDRHQMLRKQQEAFERSAPILSESARAQREKELQKFQIDVQRFIEDAQAELLGARRSVEATFLAKLQPAVEAVAKKREVQLVLNQDAGVLLWGDPAFDITADVLA